MSNIYDLLDQYCASGVEAFPLNAVCGFRNGYAFKSAKFRKSGFPILRIGNIQNKKVDVDNLVYFQISDYNENLESFQVKKGDVLIAMSGATTGKIGFLESNEVFYLNQRVGKFEPISSKLHYRFLYHYLLTKLDEIYALAGGGAQPNLSSTSLMKKITIPVPPFAVQKEIVKVLDTFTSLEAELEAELEARSAQYEYYRNKLLAFEGEEVEWKSLGEVGTFIRGNGLQKKDFTVEGVGCIHYGQIYTFYGTYAMETKSFVSPDLAKRLKKASKNDLIIAGVSENVEDVCKAVVWLGEDEICISGDAFIYKHNQSPKFLGYLFQTRRFLEFKKKYAQGAKVTRLQSGSLAKYTIPIPPLAEQERIVNILDKFDALVNDISKGIPAEITARRQQYEYYRNKLLTFKRMN